MSEDILLQTTEHRIRRLTLNRPDRRNALSSAMREAIRQAILAADYDPEISVITITGSGEAFCAGADLKEAREIDESGARYGGPLHESTRSPLEVVLDCRKPVLAIVNGPAMAGGFELALACDLRIAADTAFFGLPEAKRGMGAHLASVMLPQMVPPAVAMEWLFTGRKIELAEAQRWGLINRVVAPAELMAVAMDLAADIAASAPLSLQRLKLTYRKTVGLPLAAALRLEAGPDVYNSEDRKEGARAFLERRAPVWAGR